MTAPPLLDLAGPPRDLGRAHGEAAREPIAHNLGLYFERFAAEAGLARWEALDRAARYLAVIERQAPDYAAAMRGVAEASGSDLLEIAALNVRYEILYSEISRLNASTDALALGGRGRPRPAGGCTAFAVLPEASADGRLRIGQNWDWIPDVQGLLLRIERPDGFRLLCFTEAGIVGGKIGLNSAGLGLAINGLFSDRDDWRRLGTPFHVRTWRALNSRTLEEASAAVLDGERSCSANFLIGQSDGAGRGRAINLEAAPESAGAIAPRGGLLVHANHFLELERLGIDQPLAEEWESTHWRYSRMEALLAERRGRLDAPALLAILRDHAGHPESICRHQNPAWEEGERYETVFSTVMDLAAGEMLAAGGSPCTGEYQRVGLA